MNQKQKQKKTWVRAGPFRERKEELSLLRDSCSETNAQKKITVQSIRLRPSGLDPAGARLDNNQQKNLMPWPEGAFSLSSLAFPKTTPKQPYRLTRLT